MKVLAINSSPRTGGESKTELLLTPLVKGLADAGAQVDVVELRKKKVNPCAGCFTCWTKTPGQCVHHDDMSRELFPQFLAADLVILASPLYHYSLNAVMKAFIERTLPAIEPFMVRKGSRTSHPLRGRHPAMAILSVAGFPEMSVFDQLSSYIRFIYGPGLVAEIYRPGAEWLASTLVEGLKEDVLGAMEQAGRELAQGMKIRPETMARITQPLGDFDTLAEMANAMWETCIQHKILPREMEEKGLAPRPKSLAGFMALLPAGFKPQAAAGVECTWAFDFSGQVEGSCHFVLKDGRLTAYQGPAEKADLTIAAPFEVWLDIITGQADGGQMFMEGKYQASGDLNILLKMKEWFG